MSPQAYSALCGPRVAESDDVRAEAPKDIPLLLLCAEDSEVVLVQLVDALNRSGRAPEVVAGVESDSSLLSSAADRMRGAALFVLCQSGDLDRSQVLRLEGLFSARKGPLHRLLVVELDESRPLDSLTAIEAAMEAICNARPATLGGGGEDRVPKREVIVMPGESRSSIPKNDGEVEAASDDDPTNEITVLALEEAERAQREAAEREAAEQRAREEAAEHKAREEAEALAKAFHDEMLAAEAVLERRRAGRREPERSEAASIPASIPASIVDQLDIGIPHEVGHDPNARTRPLELDIPVAIGLGDDLPAEPEPEPAPPEPESSASDVPDALEEPEEEIGSLTSSLANVRIAEPLTPTPAVPEAIQTELTPTDTRPRRRDPEESDTSSPTQHLEESDSRRGWLLGVVGAAALGGVALFVMQGDEQSAARNMPAAASTAPAASKVDVNPPKPNPAPEAVEPEPEPTVEPEPAPEPAEPEPEPTEDPEEVEDEEEHVKPVASGSVPPPPVDSEALRIDDAILSGRIRALDALLVARPGSDAVDWSSAKSICRRKKVAGLPGWHLPSRNELARLRRARMLDEGTYWSRDRGPHDDDAYAVVSSSGVVNVYLQVEPAARVQCVRRR